MPELSALPGDVTIQPSIDGSNMNLLAADNADGNGGAVSIFGGNGVLGANETGEGGGIGLNAGVGGGTEPGGQVVMAAGANDSAAGAAVRANGAADADGGDVILVAGATLGGGAHGQIRVFSGGGWGLPTSDPLVSGALYSTAGTVKISAGP